MTTFDLTGTACGMCFRAADLEVFALGNPVAAVHPECVEHNADRWATARAVVESEMALGLMLPFGPYVSWVTYELPEFLRRLASGTDTDYAVLRNWADRAIDRHWEQNPVTAGA